MSYYVKIQVLASRTCDVVYDVVCFLYDIVRATYDVAKNVRHRTFLQVLASRTYDIVYDIVRFLTMSHTMCYATSVLYDVVRKVPMSLIHIA
jgi:hypothetical protein